MNRTLRTVILTVSLSAFCAAFNASAQTEEKKWAVGLHAGTARMSDDFRNQYFEKGNVENDWAGTFHRYINPNIDLRLSLNSGNLSEFNKNYHRSVTTTTNSGDVTINYKFLPEKTIVRPYVFAGIGLLRADNSFRRKDFVPIIPIGIGARYYATDMFQFDLGIKQVFSQSDYLDGTKAGKYMDDYVVVSGGIIMNLGGKKIDTDGDGVSDKRDQCPGTPAKVLVDKKGCPIDTDGDGTADYLDECPTVAGPVATKGCPDADNDGTADKDDLCPKVAGPKNTKGCPDKDKDGVADKDDKCPEVAGLAEFKGCPDTDGDGIQDSEDACPTVKGIAQFKGCPDTDGDGIQDSEDLCPQIKGTAEYKGCPDTDGDGIPDNLDQCPTVKGVKTNNGCPEIKKAVQQLFQQALQGIQFETGKAVLKPASNTILNSIVKVMMENKEYKLIIGGHTDDVGDDNNNMKLSQDRADAVSKYLVSKGVPAERLSAKGYGESQPVESNKTSAGRAKNRRVELKVEFLKLVE